MGKIVEYQILMHDGIADCLIVENQPLFISKLILVFDSCLNLKYVIERCATSAERLC